LKVEALSPGESIRFSETFQVYLNRLHYISWFLSDYIVVN
jgi:hypothetical protein